MGTMQTCYCILISFQDPKTWAAQLGAVWAASVFTMFIPGFVWSCCVDLFVLVPLSSAYNVSSRALVPLEFVHS